ncbi:MAG: hypothetical protein ACRD15_02330 [Vicinamibacterales bacterium]
MRHWLRVQVGVWSTAMVAWAPGHASQTPEDAAWSFSFFTPVIEMSADDIERIRSGRVVTRTIAGSGQELAVLAAGSLKVTPDAFVSRVSDIANLRRSRVVPAVARFSDPPTLDDLAALTLSEDDLQSLGECRPGDCGLKLADAEIRRMQSALANGGADDRSSAQRAFREILLERVRTYLDRGLDALPPYHDKSRPVDVGEAFEQLLDRSAYLDRAPQFRASLGGPAAAEATDSYVYWSIDDFGRKPLIRVTHAVIVRPGAAGLPDVLVGSTQIYASHYIDAALAVTTLERGAAGTAFLGYLYRARVDVLGNVVARTIVRGRIEDSVERLFTHQLDRLEGGR